MVKRGSVSTTGYGLLQMMQMLDMMAFGLDTCQRLARQVRGHPWGMHSVNKAD